MMNFDTNKVIYRKITKKNISIETVCEVGVYLPETSNIIDFIKDGKKTILVEPNPPAIEAIKKYFADYNEITLHELAIFDHEGFIELSNADASTFVSDLPASPAKINDKYVYDKSKQVKVRCTTFDNIDKGNIDLLSVDTEGSEWYVFLNIKSKPKVISVETHGKFYVNPYIDKINEWMNNNNYIVWYKDLSDTVYLRKDVAQLSLIEKIQLFFINIRIKFRKAKQVFYK